MLLKALEAESHPIDIFFKSMAGSLKKLSPERQIRGKVKISQIIGELELEEISSQGASRNEQNASYTPWHDPIHSYPPAGSDYSYMQNTYGSSFS